MTDLHRLFPLVQDDDFSRTLLRVYGEARTSWLCGIAREPAHWLFNYRGLSELQLSAIWSCIDVGNLADFAKPWIERPLLGLPIKVQADHELLPRYEIVTK